MTFFRAYLVPILKALTKRNMFLHTPKSLMRKSKVQQCGLWQQSSTGCHMISHIFYSEIFMILTSISLEILGTKYKLIFYYWSKIELNLFSYLLPVFTARRHSTTTLTEFCHFLTPLPPCVDSFYIMGGEKNRHSLTLILST